MFKVARVKYSFLASWYNETGFVRIEKNDRITSHGSYGNFAMRLSYLKAYEEEFSTIFGPRNLIEAVQDIIETTNSYVVLNYRKVLKILIPRVIISPITNSIMSEQEDFTVDEFSSCIQDVLSEYRQNHGESTEIPLFLTKCRIESTTLLKIHLATMNKELEYEGLVSIKDLKSIIKTLSKCILPPTSDEILQRLSN